MEYFHWVALGSMVVLGALLAVVLFEPALPYDISADMPASDSHLSLGIIAALVDAPVLRAGDVEVLNNGSVFYERELADIARARRSVHLEAYIFHPSAIGERFITALAERARSGVKVRVVVDAIGSMETPRHFFDPILRAGGEVEWYQPLRWHTLKRFNNRTHRELLVIDGLTGFVGGAGIGGWWTGEKTGAPWRDTVVRVSGPLAAALQTSFVENWLETKGEVLADRTDFPYCLAEVAPEAPGVPRGLVATSAPSAGKSTRARIPVPVVARVGALFDPGQLPLLPAGPQRRPGVGPSGPPGRRSRYRGARTAQQSWHRAACQPAALRRAP